MERDKTGIYGWMTTNKSNPTDSHGHGTHIAGIIGA
jgi:subtilisin family serine protease